MAILIVDDSPDIRVLLRKLLQLAGFADVLVADSAPAALRQLERSAVGAGPPIDLILMDIVMPGMNGITACRLIKADERLVDIPILMVTAQPEAEDLQGAFDAGAADYLSKPAHPGVLAARVRHALRLKGEIDRRKARESQLLESQRRLEEANARLQRLATVDGLTGVANRRQFDEFLQLEWRRAARVGDPVAVIMADVDHFKRYNDAHGHQAGDDCLREVARALEAVCTRPADLVTRYGGEEFCAILPGTDLDGALQVAERMRLAVRQRALPHGSSDAGPVVTVSLGVAARSTGDGAPEALVKEADRALYVAKHSGRDRVACAPHPVRS